MSDFDSTSDLTMSNSVPTPNSWPFSAILPLGMVSMTNVPMDPSNHIMPPAPDQPAGTVYTGTMGSLPAGTDGDAESDLESTFTLHDPMGQQMSQMSFHDLPLLQHGIFGDLTPDEMCTKVLGFATDWILLSSITRGGNPNWSPAHDAQLRRAIQYAGCMHRIAFSGFPAVRLPDNAPDRIKDGYVTEVQFLDDIILSHVIRYVAAAPTGLVERPQDQNYGFIKKPNMSLANIEFNLSLYDQLIQNDNFMNLKRDGSRAPFGNEVCRSAHLNMHYCAPLDPKAGIGIRAVKIIGEHVSLCLDSAGKVRQRIRCFSTGVFRDQDWDDEDQRWVDQNKNWFIVHQHHEEFSSARYRWFQFALNTAQDWAVPILS